MSLLITASCRSQEPASTEKQGAPTIDATPLTAATSGSPNDDASSGEPSPRLYEDEIKPLTAGATPDAEAQTRAWTHFKAKRFADAQREFALASIHDRSHWKHPFNLACASARAGDEVMTRVALTEALRRDKDPATSKARRDADLAGYHEAPWFQALLGVVEPERGEPTPAVPPGRRPVPPLGKPPGVDKPLAGSEVEAIRDALKLIHGLRPFVRGSLDLREVEGGTGAWVVYDYNRYDACRLERSEASCLDEFGDDDWGPDRPRDSILACTHQWLAHVQFGGEIQVQDRTQLEGNCALDKLRAFELVDLDADGVLEIFLDLEGSASLDGFREGTAEFELSRVMKLLRLDGFTQFDFAMQWQAPEINPQPVYTKRLAFRDLNGDGHLDLVVDSIQFLTEVINYDEQFWPIYDVNDEEEISDGQISTVETETYLYSPASDEWKVQ